MVCFERAAKISPSTAKNFLLYAGSLMIHTQASFSGDPIQAKYKATSGVSVKSNNLVGTPKCCVISSHDITSSTGISLTKKHASEIKSSRILNSS